MGACFIDSNHNTGEPGSPMNLCCSNRWRRSSIVGNCAALSRSRRSCLLLLEDSCVSGSTARWINLIAIVRALQCGGVFHYFEFLRIDFNLCCRSPTISDSRSLPASPTKTSSSRPSPSSSNQYTRTVVPFRRIVSHSASTFPS